MPAAKSAPVLSSHYHFVLRIDIDRIRNRSDAEVVGRWQWQGEQALVASGRS
jgi:hypothetical protein